MKRVYSVLIAEDESEIRRALAAMVEEHPSFRVAGCAGDGKAALRMIEALRPDVLMTDIRMPYMDGLELLQALDARGIRIKTVIISGYSSFSYARTAMKYGASDYLLKPLLPAQCQQTLDLLEKALDLQAGSFSLDIALQKPSPLPQNDIADACIRELRYFGVDTCWLPASGTIPSAPETRARTPPRCVHTSSNPGWTETVSLPAAGSALHTCCCTRRPARRRCRRCVSCFRRPVGIVPPPLPVCFFSLLRPDRRRHCRNLPKNSGSRSASKSNPARCSSRSGGSMQIPGRMRRRLLSMKH